MTLGYLQEQQALNDSVRELDTLLEDLDCARINENEYLAKEQKSSVRSSSNNNKYYSSMSNLHLNPVKYQQRDSTANYYDKNIMSPTPLQKIAKSSLDTVEWDSSRFSSSKNGVFVKDVVEEEILVDHVPLYQPKHQSSDRRFVTKSKSPRQKQVAFYGSENYSLDADNYADYDQETYDNNNEDTTCIKSKHLSNSEMSLNSLQSDLESTTNENSIITTMDPNKVVMCHICNQRVFGQVITALGRSYHKEHFTCAHCGQELGTKNFYERDNLPYCETDYQNLFSPKCAACTGPILDKVTIALEQTFHPEHFVCAYCGCQFEPDDGFHEKDGKPYCKKDYFELFANKCGGCALPITANYITALNAQWHPECFVCTDCHCPFANGKFFDIDNAPYCEIHYHARRGSLCAACRSPVIGKCTTAMFRKFHPEHFTCTYCTKVLSKTFKEEADRPYCHNCFDKLYS